MSRKRSKKAKKTRWERAADRQNERLTRAQPLFVHAGSVPRTPAADQQARVEQITSDFDARIAAGDAENMKRAVAVRARVAARVSPAELERLDAHRLIYPRTAVYALEHWKEALARLDAPTPTATPEARVLGPTCAECGWVRGCGSYHPGDCAALRALAWRLGRCADCNASPAGGCPVHVAEVKAIDAGMVPTPVEFPRRAVTAM